MIGREVVELRERLSDRDMAILETLRSHRLATTTQIRRLHFDEAALTTEAARRAAARVLLRLEGLGVVARLKQRIGGARRGSDGVMWQVASKGDQLLAVMHGEDKRRRSTDFREAFARHTTGVTDLVVELTEAERAGTLEHVRLESEPACWRHFLGAHAAREILKPDLYAITTAGDYEDHWLLEYDLESEAPSVVSKKARIYGRYAATGIHQKAHGVFPVALWVVPSEARQHALERAFRALRDLPVGMLRVTTRAEFMPTILAGSDPASGP